MDRLVNIYLTADYLYVMHHEDDGAHEVFRRAGRLRANDNGPMHHVDWDACPENVRAYFVRVMGGQEIRASKAGK